MFRPEFPLEKVISVKKNQYSNIWKTERRFFWETYIFHLMLLYISEICY